MVTVHGEVCAEKIYLCGLYRLLGPLSSDVIDCVEQFFSNGIASLLAFEYGELLPFRPFLSQSVIFNVLHVDR